jgi:hypothetical protein
MYICVRCHKPGKCAAMYKCVMCNKPGKRTAMYMCARCKNQEGKRPCICVLAVTSQKSERS